MNDALLGANCLLSSGAINQAVVPPVGLPSESAQLNAAPPHAWTSMPRWRLYQACSAGASFALKKMPPMPVTRFMCTSDVRLASSLLVADAGGVHGRAVLDDRIPGRLPALERERHAERGIKLRAKGVVAYGNELEGGLTNALRHERGLAGGNRDRKRFPVRQVEHVAARVALTLGGGEGDACGWLLERYAERRARDVGKQGVRWRRTGVREHGNGKRVGREIRGGGDEAGDPTLVSDHGVAGERARDEAK